MDEIRVTDLFARYGEDKLIILLPETGIIKAINLVKKLKKQIEEQKFIQGSDVTCSFGVSDFNQHDNIDDFIKKVDDALYNAKNFGRNRVEIY